MRVDGEQQLGVVVAVPAPPDARPGAEEALQRAQAVDDRRLLDRLDARLGQRQPVGLERDPQAPEIPDVLADRQRAVDVRDRGDVLARGLGPGYEQRRPCLLYTSDAADEL